MNQETASTDIKIIKADYTLQSKVGSGPLDERIVERCQDGWTIIMLILCPWQKSFLINSRKYRKAQISSSSLEEATQDLRATIWNSVSTLALLNMSLLAI